MSGKPETVNQDLDVMGLETYPWVVDLVAHVVEDPYKLLPLSYKKPEMGYMPAIDHFASWVYHRRSTVEKKGLDAKEYWTEFGGRFRIDVFKIMIDYHRQQIEDNRERMHPRIDPEKERERAQEYIDYWERFREGKEE